MKKEEISGKVDKNKKREEQPINREITPQEMEQVTGGKRGLPWRFTGVRGGIK